MPSANRPDVFQAHPQDGSLRRATGERLALLSNQFVQTLHLTILEQFADSTQDVLYRIGYDWGLRDFVELQRQLQTAPPDKVDLWQLDPAFVLDTWWTPLADAGWGACSFDVAAIASGVVVADLQDSAVVAALGSSDQPICHLYAGLFAAAVSFLTRAELHAAELQCRAAGAPSCFFVVATGQQIDSAETWRQQAVPVGQIVQQLR